VVGIRGIKRREKRPGIEDEHESARFLGDRLVGDLRRTPPVGRSSYADSRSTR
jgi:hypothetical protein